MNYIIARWENGEYPNRVYYTLNFSRFNHTTHVKAEALEFGSKQSARAFLNSDGVLKIYSSAWHILGVNNGNSRQ